jgi:hypothetical protein
MTPKINRPLLTFPGSGRLKKAIISLILVLLFLIAKKPVIFLSFIIISGIFAYYSALSMLPIEVGPFFFFEIIIARYFGFNYVILFAVIGYIIPKFMAGGGLKITSYAFIPVIILIAYLSSFFTMLSLSTIGYISSIILYGGEVMINTVFEPFPINFVDVLDDLVNNLAWFLLFSNVAVFFLG